MSKEALKKAAITSLHQMDRHEFASMVWQLKATRDSRFFANRYPWQSKIIFDALFDLAAEEKLPVTLFSGMRENDFYPELQRNCERVLSLNKPVRIIFAQPVTPTQEASWAMLQGEYSDLHVRHLPAYSKDLPHLLLVGEVAYRLEEPHDQDDGPLTDTSPERPARFSFNDSEFAGKLLNYVDLLMSTSRPVQS